MSFTLPSLKEAVKKSTAEQDMFLFSGGIYEDQVGQFINTVAQSRHKDKITVLLTTDGGDPHAAYRLGRFLQGLYSHTRILVVGRCKSAGTLVTIAANEIAFGPYGELGPLDVQIAKKDELVFVNSGLDTMQAFTLITGHVYTAFENYVLMTIGRSNGAISFATASQIATQLATGFISPLVAQIDPHRLGEIDRMMAIATAYGERLATDNLKPGSLERLVNDYPSHSFIIDMEEAKTLFKNVTFMTSEEIVVAGVLNKELGGCIYEPADDIVIFDVRLTSGEEAQEEKQDEEQQPSSEQKASTLHRREPEARPATPRRRAAGGRAPNGPEEPGGDGMRHQGSGVSDAGSLPDGE